MTEGEPREPQARVKAALQVDGSVVAKALHAEAAQCRDVAYGIGIGFHLGEPRTTTMEFYPAAGVVRLTTGRARIELFGSVAPTVLADGVRVDQLNDDQFLQLGLTANGDVMMTAGLHRRETSGEASEPHQESIEASNPIDHPVGQQDAISDDSRVPETASPSRSDTGQTAEQEERKRVTLRGRVGAAPVFRQTPKGVSIGRFPLAVHEEETTRWHTILTFNERTKKLQAAQLAKGQSVEVTGYVHERQQPRRDDKQKAVEEIYAVVIKPR